MTTAVIQIKTGETIVAELGNQGSEYVELKDPCIIVPVRHPETKEYQGINLVPLSPFTEGAIIMYIENILFQGKADADLAEQHKRAFNPSAILTPSSSIIV